MTNRAAYVKRSTGIECAEGLAFHGPGVYCALSKCVDEPNLKIICRQGRRKREGEGEGRRGGNKGRRGRREGEKGRREGEERRGGEKGRRGGEKGRGEGEERRGGEKGRRGKGRKKRDDNEDSY